MYCNETAVLKIELVYKQSKNYHSQVYVEECKCIDAQSQQSCMMMMMDFLRRKRGLQKINEQDVSVGESKGVEYTLLKLHENKRRA